MKHAWVVVLASLVSFTACSSSSKNNTAGVASTTTSTTIVAGITPTTAGADETTTSPATSANTVDINFHAKGSINGIDFDGPVAGDSLRCTPTGTDVQVTWGGTINIKGRGEQISGDMLVKIGGSAFPSDGTASLVIAVDYKHRVGAISGTATADAKSGTIHAQYSGGSDTGSLDGTWRCA